MEHANKGFGWSKDAHQKSENSVKKNPWATFLSLANCLRGCDSRDGRRENGQSNFGRTGRNQRMALTKTIALSINNRGEAVGAAALPGNSTSHALLWSKQLRYMIDLGMYRVTSIASTTDRVDRIRVGIFYATELIFRHGHAQVAK
jgi:hypothetical protein